MRGCDNSKIHISSNFIFSICLLIMFITLQHLATLNHTTPNYTSLHLSTLHFVSFTLHHPLIWLNPSTFPIVLFHLPSLNFTQYCSHIPKLISKVMNPFTALKNFSTFHFIFIFYLFFHLSYQPFTSLHFTSLYFVFHIYNSLPFPSLFTFYHLHFPTALHFHNPRCENMSFTVGSSYRPFR
jgi:hypothetical protein